MDGLTSSASVVIHTTGLTKAYAGVKVLDALNLQVPRNSIFGFLGPNGSGKSTTIKLLLGLIGPTAGAASVFGQSITGMSVAIRQRVGYLAQDPRYYGHMTARQTLHFTARFFYDGPAKRIAERVGETLELVGLADKADRPIRAFSGGERQRLGIAQAQVNYPDLLILDEPAAALDPQGRHDVLGIMERLRNHTTIFYSTHILEDVQRVSDRVAILNNGRLLAEAPIAELLAGKSGASIYTLTLRGDPDELKLAQSSISSQSWVSGISVRQSGRDDIWQVSVTDADRAAAQLLGLIMKSAHITVSGFGRKSHNLEDVFLQIVERSGNNVH